MAFAWSGESTSSRAYVHRRRSRPCKPQRDLSSLLQSFPDLWAAMAWRRESSRPRPASRLAPAAPPRPPAARAPACSPRRRALARGAEPLGAPGLRLQHPGGHRPVRLAGLGRQRLRRPRGGRQVGGQPATATSAAAAAAAPSRRPGPGSSDLSASAPPARPRAAGCTVVCVCACVCSLSRFSGRGCVSLLLEHV